MRINLGQTQNEDYMKIVVYFDRTRQFVTTLITGLLVFACLPTMAAPGDIIFEEEFNNNGDYISDWTRSGFFLSFVAVTTATFSSSPSSLQIGNFGVTVTSNSGRIDTSGIGGATVTAWVRRGDDSFSENPDAGEDLTFQYRNSSGTWIDIVSYPGGGTPGEILTPSFDLPADALYATFQLRFVQASGSFFFSDYWHLDDIVVTETAGSSSCTSYSDEFGSASYTNSDGSTDWTSNAWSETNDDNSPSGGLIEIAGGQLLLSGNGSSPNVAITREFNSASSTSLVLSFDYQMLGGVDTEDSALVEISGDGGSSWTTLETFVGYSNNASGSRSYDITSYAASNTQVRFAISPDSGGSCCYDSGGERWEIDNLVIDDCSSVSTDHFSIQHSGTGVTCEAEIVTITAHDSSDSAVDVGGNTIQITATSASAGWSNADTSWVLSAGSGSFSTPSAGVAQYQFGSSETSVVLSFANTSIAIIDFDVEDTADGSLTDNEGSPEDPTLTFSDTAFRFYNDADANGDRDGIDPIASPLTAGTTSGQFIVRGVQTSTDTGACIARITGAQTVNMGYQCENPTTCARPDDADINGTAIGENDLGVSSNLNAVSLTFDADGEAPFTFEYYDAGSVRLVASLPLAASGGEPAFTLFGTSDVTIVRPANLVITQVIGNPGTTTAGSGFVTSGSLFTTVVQAQNADGGTTPNFGKETSSEGIILIEQVLVMPVGGTLTPLSSPSSFFATTTEGEFENTDLLWDQAGTFTMRAQIADSDYLGTGDVIGSISGDIGRFYPDHFDLTSATLIQGCAAGSFTFMSDQSYVHRPMDALFSINALSVLSAVLTNYDSALGYPVRGFTAVAENGNDGNDQSDRAFIANSTWSGGVYAFASTDNAGFSRDLSGLNEIVDGPYSSIQLGLTVDASGPDTIDFMSADLTMQPGQSNDCVSDGDCTAAAIGSTANLVFGRLYGRSSHGPESAALAVPLETQYWDGSEYLTTTGDTCTAIAASATFFDGISISTDANRTVTVGGGNSTGSFDNLNPAVEFTMVAGESGLEFSGPGAGNTGSFVVRINLNNYPWLRSDWDNDTDNADDTNLPNLNIQFGSYRGHDRIIFWKEVLN